MVDLILNGILNCYSMDSKYIDNTTHEAYPYYCVLNEEINKLPIEVFNKIQRIVDESDIDFIKYKTLEHVLLHMFCTNITNSHIIITILFFKKLLEKYYKYHGVLIIVMVKAFFTVTGDYISNQGGWYCIKLTPKDSLFISNNCIILGSIGVLWFLTCFYLF